MSSRRDTDSNENEKPVPAERLIFARNFRKARKAAKLSQRAVKERTGFAQSWISAVETGQSPLNIDNMAALAKCVDVPLWQLLVPPS
ncbi:TPA: helix-turn-helix domain-containing protein [Escherichia coli]|uniref:helix-turn-helix domain-containing protein n=1 Tax=Klebsiella pneumoniae TaxID=573 RepID=UPI0019EB8F53|nr:helix-turn-helix transcriptional regulator [Salmonella enterica]HCF9802652.1 helix-turn-helix transcriptional regulator [Pseudomonas aeruginosa]